MLLFENEINYALCHSTVIDIPEQANKIDNSKCYTSERSTITHNMNIISSFYVNAYPCAESCLGLPSLEVSFTITAVRYPVYVKTLFTVADRNFQKSLTWLVSSNTTSSRKLLYHMKPGNIQLKCDTHFYFHNFNSSKLALTGNDLMSSRRDVDTDAEIKVGDVNMKVHRGFLSTISPVFYAMFNGDTAESRSGVVVIKDFDIVTVVVGINFCYGQPLTEKSRNGIMNVFKFVHKYDIKGAVDKLTAWITADTYIVCADYKEKRLTTQEVTDLLTFANLYSLSKVADILTTLLIGSLSVANFNSVLKYAYEMSDEKLKEGCLPFYRNNVAEITKTLTDSLIVEIFKVLSTEH